MSMYFVNPADERSLRVMVDERHERLRSDASMRRLARKFPNQRPPGRSLRHLVGLQLVKLGARVSGVSMPELRARLEAS
jgi:hypothetical protein